MHSIIRVAICQPRLPHYRIPVFDLLGKQVDIELSVFASDGWGSLKSYSGGKYFKRRRSVIYRFHLGQTELFYQPSQWDVINHTEFDVVILPWNIRYITLVPALIKSKLNKVSILLWGHGYSKNPVHMTEWVRNVIGKLADGVVLYSYTVARELKEKYRFEEKSIFVAQNAIDQTPIQEAKINWLKNPKRLAEFREINELDPKHTVIFVSRLERSNKVGTLIEAFKVIKSIKPEAKLVIVGDGPDKRYLIKLTRSLDLEKNIIFTGAIYEEIKLAPWMLSSCVFCYPKNIGLSLLHAFGYGLPVVTSNNIRCHNPEIDAFVDGNTGLFYKNDDVVDMARQCLRIMEDEELRNRLSSNALKQVTCEYTIEKMVKGLISAIKEVYKTG